MKPLYVYRIWNEEKQRFESSGQGGLYKSQRTGWFNRSGAVSTLRHMRERGDGANCVIKKYMLLEVEDDH